MNKKLTGLLLLLVSVYGFSQSVIISPDGTAIPHASAILELRSNNKGFLPPRLTEAERNSITGPALGLMIFNSTANKMQWFDGGKWSNIDGTTTKTPTEILTAHAWKLQELRYLYQNVLNHYQRGVPGSVDYYANEWLHFKNDQTGVTNDNIPFTWEFLDAAKSKLRIVIAYTHEPTLTVNWEHVVFKESTITYSEYWTRPGGSSISFATRIPR